VFETGEPEFMTELRNYCTHPGPGHGDNSLGGTKDCAKSGHPSWVADLDKSLTRG
jgi:hypothetical protein